MRSSTASWPGSSFTISTASSPVSVASLWPASSTSSGGSARSRRRLISPANS